MYATHPTVTGTTVRARDHGGMVQTVDFRDVQICRAGEWNALFGDGKITREELESVVAAYQDQEVDRPRLKFGHRSSLNTALGDGLPAFGWVENPRMDPDGVTLRGDLVDVPRKLGGLIGRGYRNVSIEFRRQVTTPSGKKYPAVLSALALLGEKPPAVKGMDDLVALYASEGEGGAPEDDCTAESTDTVSLGDALYGDALDTHPTVPNVVAGVVDSETESPEVPGPETEGEPTMAFLDQAREKLGLPKDATEDDILAGMTALSEAPAEKDGNGDAAPEAKAPETGDKDQAPKAETPETVTVSKAAWEDAQARLGRLEQDAAAKHQAQVIETALSEGRIVPAEREKWTTALSAAPEATEVLLSSLAPRVNMRETGSDVALSAGNQDGEADEVDTFLDSLNLS